MAQLYENSIFWIDVDKIKPNPYQPRREFDDGRLSDLANSIRQYGILQPLTVSRNEVIKEDGVEVEYELIAGERRLRASKLAGVREVPVVIRVGDDSMTKLELAIIENLQREDLNAVERARAFMRLAEEFKFTHLQIGTKVGKSREYVSNTLRLLSLPQEVLDALSQGKISEGHTRPIMMLADKPEEQIVFFKEIMFRKMTVREAERLSRKIATDRVRKKEYMVDPEIQAMEEKLQETLGTRVHIEKGEVGGQIKIDFFSNEDLDTILNIIKSSENIEGRKPNEMINKFIDSLPVSEVVVVENEIEDDRTKEEIKNDEEETDLYNIKKFSL
ncbi:ParB/RepB/Spo0J family partition protein [Candidatus Nomurabacteria bacterium]|nr:ParB/RepB/Spo0J family partition protein [Candidatus Nomurabacteria bacterium]